MSFQAYIDNIQAKTGKLAAELRGLVETAGFVNKNGIVPGVKAGQIPAPPCTPRGGLPDLPAGRRADHHA